MADVTDSEETPHRSVRIPDDLWDAARDKATREGHNVSWVIRKLLRQYIR